MRLNFVTEDTEWWKPVALIWLFAVGGYYTGKQYRDLYREFRRRTGK